MTIPIPLQEALRDSITSGIFVDTKFWVFSKRGSKTGRVGGPRALYVSGHVAKQVPRLGTLLNGRKPKENLRTRFPTDRKPYTSNYDYEDDSDLEEDDDEDDSDLDDGSVVASQAETKLEDGPEPVTVENLDVKDNESPDVISISDLDSLFSEPPDTKGETNPVSPTHIGKVAVIEDVAFVTFQAFLRYLYTNEIEFASWGSTERRRARARKNTFEPHGIRKPSPKSVYRLADKYDIPELKELALRQIQRDLSKCDITEEVFSKYASWYPELKELGLKQLARVLLSSDPDRTLESLKEKVKSYTRGELPHAKHVISGLYQFMESDESVEEPPHPSAVRSNQQKTDGDWAGLKKALTSSLTSGTFLDSQFYVESRSSTGPAKTRQLYFCSSVNPRFASTLMACSSRFRVRPRKSAQFADGYDSDMENEEPNKEGSSEFYPRFQCIRENLAPTDSPIDPALLFNFGAPKTWSAIFLYVYTGQIKFAAIGSQSATSKKKQSSHPEAEAKPPPDKGGRGVPHGVIVAEPCSPKSIYCLANKAGFTGLRDVAFKDIQSKLDENNILEELFSPFSADHKDVREMEHELFQSKLKPLVDHAVFSEIVENSSSGERPYRAEAMGLVLEGSIRERRKRVVATTKNSQSDSTTRPKGCKKTQDVPIQKEQLPVAAPLLQESPQLPSDPIVAPASKTVGASPKSSTLSKPPEKSKTRHGEPPAIPNANPPPERTVELVCAVCGVKCHSSGSPVGSPVCSCKGWFRLTKCAGCGTISSGPADTCASCHGKFKTF